MSDIVIYATANSTQTGLQITDQTDWTSLGDTIASLTSISIGIYLGTSLTPSYSYSFTPEEVTEYVTNGTIELLFKDIASTTYIDDNWWSCKMTAVSETYVSNYSEFGTYGDITYNVFSLINDINTPEDIKYNAERYCQLAMFVNGLQWLDTSSVNERGTKFNKRLLSLQKMISSI